MPTFLQKIISYLYPVTLQKVFTEYSNNMVVMLYRNQIMISTDVATYSQGVHYNPFKMPFDYIVKNNKALPNTFLMLGGGLASGVQILNNNYACYPSTTIVEKDIEIIQLAYKYLPKPFFENCSYIHQDAVLFMQNNKQQYHCIGLDIFIDLVTPSVFLEMPFLLQCKNSLITNGYIIVNTFLSNDGNAHFKLLMEQLFTNTIALKNGGSTFYIGFANA
jgi:hypothetical protein